jgi:hypothetical protein
VNGVAVGPASLVRGAGVMAATLTPSLGLRVLALASSYGGADAGNYSITGQATTTANITPKALTVSGITAAGKVYDGGTTATVSTAGATYTGLVGGDNLTVSTTGSFGDKNVGNSKTVTLASSYTGTDLGNYSITDQATATANITPKALTVSGITAADKVYDGSSAATVNIAGASYTGIVSGDDLTVSATGSFSDKNVGNGKTVMMREIDVPIRVKGRHWGGFRTAYRL